LEEALNKKND